MSYPESPCSDCGYKSLCECPAESVDARWTRFVRQWRDMMRSLFMPRCSRSEPCCERECRDLAEHFNQTGDIP